MVPKKPRLNHEILEHIPSPFPVWTKILDQIVLEAELAPAREMKWQKKFKNTSKDILKYVKKCKEM